jgi:IclR family transcriptional regulator, acetate operon repressor
MVNGEAARPSVADRMFTVLDAFAAHRRPLTLVDLGELTGLPKSTLHRVCWKLVELRVLLHTADGFEMGARLYALGAMSPGLRRLRARAMPLLHALVVQSGRVANLGVLCERRALVVDEVAGAVQFPPRDRMIGTTLPLYATAVGKALLANGPASLREELLASSMLRPYTRHTIVRTTLLREHLEAVVRQGYAVSNEELQPGVMGVAAPVVVGGELVAAIALVGAPDDSAPARLSKHVRLAADRLATALSPTAAELAR